MTTTTADKYLLRTKAAEAAPEPEPERLTEADALKVVVSATGGAACPVHEVGPVANHLRGPVAAVPPEGHPDRGSLATSGGSLRRHRAANLLLADACGMDSSAACECACGGASKHMDCVTFRNLKGKATRPPRNSASAQQYVADAFKLRDVDLLLHAAEPRLWALCILADRARVEHGGGDLPEVVAEAVVTVANTLTGPGRWDVRAGLQMHDWPVWMRTGATFDQVQTLVLLPAVHDRVIERLLLGR